MAEAAIHAALKVTGDVLASELVKLVVSQTSNIGLTFAKLKASINNISRELRVMKGYLDEMKIDDEDSKSQVASKSSYIAACYKWSRKTHQEGKLRIADGIAELKKLRHLFAQIKVDPTYRTFRTLAGISLPKGICYLKELQTLQALESNAIIVRELGNLTQLRSFRILNVNENHSAELCRSLSKMSSLSYLSIFASNENYLLQLEGLKFLPQLQKLCLFGRLKQEMLKSPLFQNSGDAIQMLRLGWSQLQKDPLPSLSHLKNLTWLTLQKAYEGRKLNFKAGWFPKLKFLSLRQMPNLVNVEMEQDTMVIIETIHLWELEQLVEIPKGIEDLINLKWMVCKYMPAGFGELASGIHQLFHFRCHVF